MSSFQIPITHFTEQDFLNAFRADLAGSTHQVTILSPFLSQNRAIYYYPVLRSLLARRVMIDCYTKPKHEQPQSLREHFEEVERSLKSVGVMFHVRSGMHEKVGVLDNRILWHGSLNILSHNDTRESMLRFESPELVQEVLADLGLAPGELKDETSKLNRLDRNTLAASLAHQDAPRCPQCGQAMLLFKNAGMWICEDSPTCSGTLPLNAAVCKDQVVKNNSNSQSLGLLCPLCCVPLGISQGMFLRVACSSPNCGFALDSRLANSLLRVLRQRVTR